MRAAGAALLLSLAPGAVAPAPAAAEPPAAGPLTVAAAVEAALERFPSVAVSQARQRAAAAAVEAAEASRLPAASLGARSLHYQEPVPVTPFHGFTPGAFPEFDDTLVQGELYLRHSLYSGGARGARIRQAQALAGAAAADLTASRDEIAARTVAAFLRVLGLAETLSAHDRRLAALGAERSQVEQLLATGRAAQVDLRRIEAALAAARAERVRLAAALGTAEEDLGRLLGAPPGTVRAAGLVPVRLEGAAPGSREGLAGQVLDASPAAARARQELLAAEGAVALARSGRRPSLRLEGLYQELGGADLDFSSEWTVALQVGLTLFDGGATRAGVRRALAERDAAAERLRLLETELLGQLDRALADAAQAAARVESLERAVESFGEVARVEKLRLEAGVGIQADYLDAEAQVLAASASLTEARYGQAMAATEVARIAGTLDPRWVETHLVETTP